MAHRFYRRKLPHWQPDGAVLFVTFRTVGSLPEEATARLEQKRLLLSQPAETLTAGKSQKIADYKRLFDAMDRELAAVCRDLEHPSCVLVREEVADVLLTAIKKGQQLGRFLLHRYGIMPNHVHLLIEPLPKGVTLDVMDVAWQNPQWPPVTTDLVAQSNDQQFWEIERVMGAMKSTAARGINKVLGRTGELFQDENFDHWIRDEVEYQRVINYIDQNPVVAGLCDAAENWRWGSAGE